MLAPESIRALVSNMNPIRAVTSSTSSTQSHSTAVAAVEEPFSSLERLSGLRRTVVVLGVGYLALMIWSIIHESFLSKESSSSSSSAFVGEMIEETGFYQSIRLSHAKPIYRKQSRYQQIEVFESKHYGKILVLDNVLQLTERDGDSYNEMMAHMPMFQHRDPRRVLIIGGGDGYVLNEVLKHPSVQHVDHVDLDEDVIRVCQEHFSWSHAWEDPRVHLHITDGAHFVEAAKDQFYDVIIQDSSDPWTWGPNGEKIILPSSALYSQTHFHNIHRILKPNGILNIQAETLQIPSDMDGTREWRQLALSHGFESARYGSIMISSYPTGQIGFLMCEKNTSAASSPEHIARRFQHMQQVGNGTHYYHPGQSTAAFVLPLWAQNFIYSSNHNVDNKVSILLPNSHHNENGDNHSTLPSPPAGEEL
jgi:spermidine synthase